MPAVGQSPGPSRVRRGDGWVHSVCGASEPGTVSGSGVDAPEAAKVSSRGDRFSRPAPQSMLQLEGAGPCIVAALDESWGGQGTGCSRGRCTPWLARSRGACTGPPPDEASCVASREWAHGSIPCTPGRAIGLARAPALNVGGACSRSPPVESPNTLFPHMSAT